MPAPSHSLLRQVFKGWPAIVLTQGTLALSLVPAVGGRLMGMRSGEHELCFIHPALEGRTFSGDEAQWASLCGDWSFPLWGGGKTWVAPESAWPQGAPHRDLDNLPWTVTESWCDAKSLGVTLVSPVCSITGLQITRRLHWPVGSAEWSITHTLRNAGTAPIACGVWDVLMLRRPATVTLPLPTAAQAVTALPGKPAMAALEADGTLELAPTQAVVHCVAAQEFKCGFQSAQGEVQVDFAGWQLRYTRHSAMDATRAYAHGHPLEVFNAPALPYFEVETHSPLQTLAPGDCLEYRIHERVEPLGSAAHSPSL